MDQVLVKVVGAVESGAATMRDIVDATGLSRLKVERALSALEKQKLLFRDGQGFRTAKIQAKPRIQECGSCSLYGTLLEVTAVGKPVNQWCKHCDVDKGCTIYDDRPQMCRSFSCAWWQGYLNDE